MTTLGTTPAPTPAGEPAAAPPPPSMRLRELAFGAACAAALRAAARLRIADALTGERASAEELSEKLGTPPATLRRLLRTLACYGVFTEHTDGTFGHTDTSRLLREDDPHSLLYIVLWCTEPWTWDVWPRLDEAVRSGSSVFQDVFGKEFFDHLHEDAAESAQVFNRAMTTSSVQSALDVAELLDLTGVRTVADIGGGQGHVLASLLEKHPGLSGTLMDLPGVVARADARLRDEGPLAARTRIVAGDCREAVPFESDLYVVKNILEWDDESTRRCLANLVAAAPPGARVVVIENLVDDTPSMRFTSAMDLLLLLNVGGAKHTRQSLVDRITAAGLTVGEVRPVNAYLHAFECLVPGD
ncbi:methyltransferase [Streptomyces sp. DW26H14]|uniref:methyltransferase n=1 Tax=Streptomyces sp. DW26H14 TaxID=3435395 RepID=UPI00403D74D7